MVKYLNTLGIDSKGMVIQRSAHNYAGPSCPGVGWMCTTAKRVVQISYKGNDSRFFCTPSTGGSATPPDTCTIIQVSAGGTNVARCTERSNAAAAAQSCVIRQTNTTGNNIADIRQTVDANGGAAQDATQYAGVSQQTGGGGWNLLHVDQDLKQKTKDTDANGAQNQNGHQGVSVNQQSDTGDNAALVNQSLAEKAKAKGLTVVQNQNTATDSPICQPSSSGCPNTNAGIEQFSNSGRNLAVLNQSHDLNGKVSRRSNGSQQQGQPGGGLHGHFDQQSTGLSIVKGNQNERQILRTRGNGDRSDDGDDDDDDGDNFDWGDGNWGNGKAATSLSKPSGNVSQTQYGPAYFGSQQGSNPNDVYDINQNSEQRASNPSLQDDRLFGNCDTSGNCTANQRIQQQNQQAQTNSCSGQSCHIGLIVTSTSEGTSTSTCTGLPQDETENPCPSPPPPPPPPFQGCEFECLSAGPPKNGP